MQVTLNIGLETSLGSLLNPWRDVLPVMSQVLAADSANLQTSPYVLKDGTEILEGTLVVRGTYHGTRETLAADLYAASVILNQDCIAVQYSDGTGDLFGPHTEEYGEFNPKYFHP